MFKAPCSSHDHYKTYDLSVSGQKSLQQPYGQATRREAAGPRWLQALGNVATGWGPGVEWGQRGMGTQVCFALGWLNLKAPLILQCFSVLSRSFD